MDVLKNRAGRQLLQVAGWSVLLWLACFVLRDYVFGLVQIISAGNGDLIILSLIVLGIASFGYSVLRILDMRDEMESRRRAFDAADHIATHDHLTKLPNRYAFDRFVLPQAAEEEAEMSAASSQTATVFSIDLDGFKKVNDLLGHQGGDALLKEVARRICALADHECVFRFGGDEFVAVARNLSPDKELLFAQLLIHSVSRPVRIDALPTQVGASVGYARMPEHGATLEDVRHRSDIALYEAKARGHNQFALFEHGMQEKVAQRAKLEGELRRAIENKAIQPHYQPLISLKTGQLCGFEALARWRNSDGVFVSPQEFIAVAEETGLITVLFEQLLTQACRDAQMWSEPLLLAFNVSPVQIEDRLLSSRILSILAETGLAPSRLEIEITENALIGDPELAASTIEQLHVAGIQVALDDFGTGYSSLSQLARFRFDKIKIDKSFVSSCVGNDKNTKIIDAILGLGRSLNLKTTVEGIEENAQLAYFLGQGCDIGQGYLFGKAMDQEQALTFAGRRRELLSA